MNKTVQISPEEAWVEEPELRVVQRNGDKLGTNGSTAKAILRPNGVRRDRPELRILGWEARSERLTIVRQG